MFRSRFDYLCPSLTPSPQGDTNQELVGRSVVYGDAMVEIHLTNTFIRLNYFLSNIQLNIYFSIYDVDR